MHAVSAIIGLGTNLPWRGLAGLELLRQAMAAMEAEGLKIRAASSVWKTPPWPSGSAQPDYHNAVVELEPDVRLPEELFAALRRVEQAFGRERRERWGPRTLDLDILAMGDLAGAFGPLELPHPRLQEREFVLAPLAEILPVWRHPLTGRTASELLHSTPAQGAARRLAPLRPP